MTRVRTRCPWLVVVAVLLSGAGQPSVAWGAGTVALEAGYSWLDDIEVRRLVVGWAWEAGWELPGDWRLQPQGEFSVGHMRPTHAAPEPGTAEVYETGLRLVLRLLAGERRGPFWEAGFGPVYLSDDTVGRHKLGSLWQFRTHVGIGWVFGRRHRPELAYRYSHTSNGHLGWPNPGVNLHTLRLAIAF